jgi:hypothetical protein
MDGGDPRRDNPRRPRVGVGPKIIFGIIALLIAVRVLPLVLMGAARLFSMVMVPFGIILVPIVIIMALFWPVMLIGAIGWGASRLAKAGRHLSGSPADRGALPGQSARGPRYGEASVRPTSARTRMAPVHRAAPSEPALAAVLNRGWELLDRSRRAIRQFPDIAVRQRAAAIVDQGEQILDILREGRGDVALATKFVEQYVTPTTTILERYARLANHRVASAQPTLDHVVQHDLPMIERKFQEFYERLHRGDLIDLEVASEMLEFELGHPDATAR